MVNTFVSSHAARWGSARFGVASFSVLAHVSLITLAVVQSGRTSSGLGAHQAAAPIEHLRFVNVRELVGGSAAVRRDALAHAARKAAQLLVPNLTRLHLMVDASMTAVPKIAELPLEQDFASQVSRADDFAKVDTRQLVEGTSMYAIAHPGREGAYTSDAVEKTAWPRENNPRPRYPDALKSAGIEGSFVVEFVVDSTGRVDPNTLSFPKTAHPAFLRAVRDALLHSRYFPAELAGLRVRQLVEQQFTFVIAR
jgi:TonB family protein